MENYFPAIAGDTQIYVHASDFPTDRAVVQVVGQSPGAPGVLHVAFAMLDGGILSDSVKIPSNTSAETLMELSASLVPPGVQGLRGDANGPNRNSVLYVSPRGNLFLGVRVHVEQDPEFAPADPATLQMKGAYWGNLDSARSR